MSDNLHPNDPVNAVAEKVLDCAFALHRLYGPGLLESAYEALLAYELEQLGLKVERQKILPLHHKGVDIDNGYRLDLLIGDLLIVELKCIDKILPIHQAQVITYLKLSQLRLGLLLNFKSTLLKDGIKRIVV